MFRSFLLLLCLLLPAAGGIAGLFTATETLRKRLVAAVLGAELALSILLCLLGGEVTLFAVGSLKAAFLVDVFGRFFGLLFSLSFLCAGIFGFEYMSHEEHKASYWLFYLCTLSAMQMVAFAANVFTFYLSFEFMTLLSMPLVLHNRDTASRKAAMLYFGYSVFGACLALLGFFWCGADSVFVFGGALSAQKLADPMALAAAFCLLFGFGAKTGMVPLHAWLPAAHPEAPAPASAVLSGCITKAGVMAALRVTWCLFGVEFLAGTWVQQVMLCFVLLTVFTGSMLAYKERLFKRRLAWSSVSQVSYVLVGIYSLSPVGLQGSLYQVAFHLMTKTLLFLSVGAIIHQSGKLYADELEGLGKRMPVVFVCYTLGSLSLIGIPPFGGFVAKWYLAQGALAGLGAAGLVACGVLIVSALLTAGYLLPVSIEGFFPKNGEEGFSADLEPGWCMKAPLIFLAVMVLVCGIFAGPLYGLFFG